MNATPPEASSEYSKGSKAPSTPSARSAKPRSIPAQPAAPARTDWPVIAIVACALVGALLLFVAEFTALFQVHASNVAGAIKSVSTGSHDTYALIPIALAVVVLAIGFWRTGARSSLLAIGVLSVVVLLISLLGDLPDAHASGLLGSGATHYVDASSTPSAGFYMETLGAVLLLISCVCGFLLIGPPPKAPRSAATEEPGFRGSARRARP